MNRKLGLVELAMQDFGQGGVRNRARHHLEIYAGNKTRTMRREEPERLTPQAPD